MNSILFDLSWISWQAFADTLSSFFKKHIAFARSTLCSFFRYREMDEYTPYIRTSLHRTKTPSDSISQLPHWLYNITHIYNKFVIKSFMSTSTGWQQIHNQSRIICSVYAYVITIARGDEYFWSAVRVSPIYVIMSSVIS